MGQPFPSRWRWGDAAASHGCPRPPSCPPARWKSCLQEHPAPALCSAAHPPLPCLQAMPATLPGPGINIPGEQLWPFCVIGIHDTSDQKPFLNLGDSDRWEINCALGLIAPAGRGCCGGMSSFPALW